MPRTDEALARLVRRPLYNRAAAAYGGLFPRFDPYTRLITVGETLELPGGPARHTWRMRTFRPAELTAMLQSAGFAMRGLWG